VAEDPPNSDGESLPVPFAAHSGGQFVEPWLRRVREVDDHTMNGLLKTLVGLRRLKYGVTAATAVAGSLVFGIVDAPALYALMIHATLAAFVALPVFGGGSLAVRRLFLREAKRQGVSKSASMLILTRAERRARLLAPWKGTDEKLDLLLKAVREPDTA
jgi:hypothetical protein